MSACTLQNPHLKPPLAPVVHSVPLSVLINACVGANQEWPPFLMPDIFNVRCRQCLRIRVDHVEWPPFPVAILPINRALPTCLRLGFFNNFRSDNNLTLHALASLKPTALQFKVKSRTPDLIWPDLICTHLTQPHLISPLHYTCGLPGISSVPKLLMKGVRVPLHQLIRFRLGLRKSKRQTILEWFSPSLIQDLKERARRNEKVVTSGPVNCLLVIKTGEREEGTTIGFEVKDGELYCTVGFWFNDRVKVFELNWTRFGQAVGGRVKGPFKFRANFGVKSWIERDMEALDWFPVWELCTA